MPVEQPLSERKCKQSGKKVNSQDNGSRMHLTGLGCLWFVFWWGFFVVFCLLCFGLFVCLFFLNSVALTSVK